MQSAPLAEVPGSTATTGGNSAPAPNEFVINLVSSTSPVALTRPDHAGLKRFTFFVSRRREEGRESFRLHMGYFDTQEEAEQLLDIVRSLYPGAWIGLAPGRRAISRAAPAAATAPAPVVRPARATPTAAAAPALALIPDQGRRLIADVTDKSERQAAARSLSNVRDAIASLDDGVAAPPTISPIPQLAAAVIPTVRPPAPTPTKAAKPERAAGNEGSVLTNSGVVRVLEGSDAQRSEPPPPPALPPMPTPTESRPEPRADRPYYAVQLLWSVQPIDLAQVPQLAIFGAYVLYGAEGNRDGRRWYGLRLGFFTDAVSAKQVAQYVRADFATVSVVPVTAREREQAQQAIARSSGVTDAVRVSRVEGGASATGARAASSPAAVAALPAKTASKKKDEFEFIDDDTRASPRSKTMAALRGGSRGAAVAARAVGRAGSAAKQSTPTAALRSTRVAAAKRRKPGQVQANARTKPKTLEETLEILGANQLQVDDEPLASLNDSGVRHLQLQVSKDKPSKLSRLIGRLSERLGD